MFSFYNCGYLAERQGVALDGKRRVDRPHTVFPVQANVALEFRAVFQPSHGFNDLRKVIGSLFGYGIRRFYHHLCRTS